MITNVNTGVDPARIQNNEPPFFVNWQEGGENHYVFSSMVWRIEEIKKKLLSKQLNGKEA